VGEGALPGARVLLRRRVEGGDVAAAGGALKGGGQDVGVEGGRAEAAGVRVRPPLLPGAGVATHQGPVGVEGDEVALGGQRGSRALRGVGPQGAERGGSLDGGTVDGLLVVSRTELRSR